METASHNWRLSSKDTVLFACWKWSNRLFRLLFINCSIHVQQEENRDSALRWARDRESEWNTSPQLHEIFGFRKEEKRHKVEENRRLKQIQDKIHEQKSIKKQKVCFAFYSATKNY